jgi:hypothetical protein
MTLDLKEFIRFIFSPNSEFMHEDDGVYFWNILKFNKWIDKLAKQVFTIAGREYDKTQYTQSIDQNLGDVGFSIPLHNDINTFSFILFDGDGMDMIIKIYFKHNESTEITIDYEDSRTRILL